MSRFTNDVDTISEALNNSFTTLIQSFFTIAGTIICIILLNFKLSLIVLVFMLLMFFFIKYSGARGKRYFNSQQKYLGEVNGFIEEMVGGQKVEKVFNHEEVDFKEFPKEMKISGKLHKCISVFRNADSYNRQPLLCQLCGFCMCRWFVCDPRDDGSRKPCIVSGLRQAECDAGQSVYNAGQFPAGSIVRSREDFRYDG